MSRNLIKDEERKMLQDAVATSIKKDNFVHEIMGGLGEEILKEPNKIVPKIGFFGKLKKMLSK